MATKISYGRLDSVQTIGQNLKVQLTQFNKDDTDPNNITYTIKKPEIKFEIIGFPKQPSVLVQMADKIKANSQLEVICSIDLDFNGQIKYGEIKSSMAFGFEKKNLNLMQKKNILLDEIIIPIKENIKTGQFFKGKDTITVVKVEEHEPEDNLFFDTDLPLLSNDLKDFWKIQMKSIQDRGNIRVSLSPEQIRLILDIWEKDDGGMGDYKHRIKTIKMILESANVTDEKDDSSVELENILKLLEDLFMNSIISLESYYEIYKINGMES